MEIASTEERWQDLLSVEQLRVAMPLERTFYHRSTAVVARELLGKLLVMEDLAGVIVETEAYLGREDGASHAAAGPTARNGVMFGPAGVSYVYFIYGMHYCLNVVAHPEGEAGAVLLRAVEPLCGLERMRERRQKARRPWELTSGPGKLGQAFGIGARHNGLSLAESALRIVPHPAPGGIEIAVSPRIGIRKCADWPLRFFVGGHPCVSRSRWRPGLGPDETLSEGIMAGGTVPKSR
ncbi:MAG: DNA-3-methyladenine glycosylase [Bryobacterales bacterium]|jgi:DNA-3-methyladenine glycosylase|nr:DNA-3-methyladenine glycosylase [Bryobacterales bacterium]